LSGAGGIYFKFSQSNNLTLPFPENSGNAKREEKFERRKK
jgi:hypothetical protein